MTMGAGRFRSGSTLPAWLLAAAPLAWLGWATVNDSLGANPVEALAHQTGLWSLRLLLLALAMTPLRRLTGWRWPLRVRRAFGVMAFVWALLHFAIYLVLDQGLDPVAVWEDVVKRPFITVGFTALVLLVPLAATSTDGMMRRLGGRWKRLHRLAYVVPVLAVLHFVWLVKADLREPLIYAAILALLLGLRLRWWLAGRPAASTIQTSSRL